MKRYKEILKERITSKEIALKFGDILFGDYRKKGEKDTEYEAKIFNALYNWVSGSYMHGKYRKNFNLVINELKQLKTQYPDVLKPTTNVLYRLMDMDLNNFKNDIIFFKKENNRWYNPVKHLYTPLSYVTSWTTSEGVAFGFKNKPVGLAIDRSIPYNFSIRIVAKATFPDDELLFNPSFFNSLSLEITKNRQNEILHLGKKPIKVNYIFDDASFFTLLGQISYKNVEFNYNGKNYTVHKDLSYKGILELTDGKQIIKINRFRNKILKGEIKLINLGKIYKEIT